MKCSRCQHDNTPAAKFCEECAAPLIRTCVGCGTQLSASAKFCPECGQPAGAAPAAAVAPPPTVYTPKHLAEKILSSRDAIEGERKLVTVLFADLKGSMELIHERDPEDARSILDPVLKLMMDAVHFYEGTVSLGMGDGIMAIFGAPLAHEDHAVRACYAALRMQEQVRVHAEEALRTWGVPIEIRVGLNSGDVVVRSVRSDLHMDYTAIGETTHLAARMEQTAMPGTILAGPGTMRLTEGYVVMKPLGPRQVKGRATPIEVYEVVGATTVRSRLQATAARGLAGLVGRAAEMELLSQSLERARGGQGQVVAIVGEAGIGKSRMLWELRHSPRAENWLVLESSSVSYGKSSSYLPLIELVKAYFHIDPADDAQRVRDKVTEGVLALDPALQPYIPALFSLLDVPQRDPAWDALDPPQRRQRTLDGVRSLLLVESRTRPVMVLLEDLQWIDAETQAFLDCVVDSLPKARILLLANYRPEYQHTWARKSYYRELRLDALPPDGMDALLDSMLGPQPALAPLKRLLIERTEGNPFFLEESIRALVEMQFLDGQPGNYRLLKAAETLQIPPSAQAILTARIDRLSTEDKRVLQAAAVIGKDVPFSLLRELTERDEQQLRATLNNLQAAEFLYEAALFPELEFTFRNSITQGVAYRSLVNERRRSLHAAILQAIERVYPDRLAERLERLAHHAYEGEVWGKAVSYSRQAGQKALARSANREAITSFEQALAALKRLPEARDRDELGVDLRFDMRLALMPLGEFPRTLEVLHEAKDLATGLGDQLRLAWVSGYMANLFWEMGEQDHAVASGLRAMEFATSLNHDGVRDLANRYLGRSYHATGDYRRAVEVFLESVGPVHESAHPLQQRSSGGSSVLTRTFLMLSLTELGAFSDAIAHGRKALRMAEELDHPFNLSAVQSALGRVYLRKGEYGTAAGLLESSLAICKSANIALLFPFSASPLGATYARMGRLAEALPLLEEAAERAAAMRRMVDQPLWVYWLAQALLLAEEVDRADELASRALNLAVTYKERGSEAWVHRLLGDINAHAARRNLQAAEGHYLRARDIARELGMAPLLARVSLALAGIHEQLGKSSDAREGLTRARKLCAEMDMAFWREQADDMLARIGDGFVPSAGG